MFTVKFFYVCFIYLFIYCVIVDVVYSKKLYNSASCFHKENVKNEVYCFVMCTFFCHSLIKMLWGKYILCFASHVHYIMFYVLQHLLCLMLKSGQIKLKLMFYKC